MFVGVQIITLLLAYSCKKNYRSLKSHNPSQAQGKPTVKPKLFHWWRTSVKLRYHGPNLCCLLTFYFSPRRRYMDRGNIKKSPPYLCKTPLLSMCRNFCLLRSKKANTGLLLFFLTFLSTPSFHVQYASVPKYNVCHMSNCFCGPETVMFRESFSTSETTQAGCELFASSSSIWCCVTSRCQLRAATCGVTCLS